MKLIDVAGIVVVYCFFIKFFKQSINKRIEGTQINKKEGILGPSLLINNSFEIIFISIIKYMFLF